MAHAFKNNTADLDCSQYSKYKKDKTNYNYCRLLSLNNKKSCKNNKFSNSNGTIILNNNPNVGSIQLNKNKSDNILSQLTNARNYDLLYSINYGYYLPTHYSLSVSGENFNNYYTAPYTFLSDNCLTFEFSGIRNSITSNSLALYYNTTTPIVVTTVIRGEGPNTLTQEYSTSLRNSVPLTDLGFNSIVVGEEGLSDYIISTTSNKKNSISDYYKDSNLYYTNFIHYSKNNGDNAELNKFLSYLKAIEYPNQNIKSFFNNKPIYFFNNCQTTHSPKVYSSSWSEAVETTLLTTYEASAGGVGTNIDSTINFGGAF